MNYHSLHPGVSNYFPTPLEAQWSNLTFLRVCKPDRNPGNSGDVTTRGGSCICDRSRWRRKAEEGLGWKKEHRVYSFAPIWLTFCTWLQVHPALLKESVLLPLPETLLPVLSFSRSTLKGRPRCSAAFCLFPRVAWALASYLVIWPRSCVCNYAVGFWCYFLVLFLAWRSALYGQQMEKRVREEGTGQIISLRFQSWD